MSRRNYRKNSSFKRLVIASSVTLLAAVIVFVIAYTAYNNKVKENLQDSLLKAEELSDLIANENSSNLVEEANKQIGKSIEESMEESKDIEVITPKVQETDIPEIETATVPSVSPSPVVEPVPEFIMPVDGEVVKEYAKETLLYSPTLDEWVTHLGIDIKADKMTVVKASSAGKVIAIKNDPRYGLTVVLEHPKGFKTVYSNLLTAEYISLGQVLESGQTIGTVGNTATFEILDEPHLHFEILENDESIDPYMYLK